MMKTITLAVTAMLSLAVLTMTAMSQSQTGETAYEKKSYNYAEWAKGRFSEVVTVRNAGKVIYLGGVGAEDENSAQGGVMRHLGAFGAQWRYAWDKSKRLLEAHGAPRPRCRRGGSGLARDAPGGGLNRQYSKVAPRPDLRF